jgi:hypothetical protein
MNQIDCFDRVTFPRVHRNDPRSSHEAAAAGEKSGAFKRQAELVLAWLKKWPQATSAELAKVSGLDLYVCRRRLDDLNKCALVQRLDPTEDTVPCQISGKKVCRWIAK